MLTPRNRKRLEESGVRIFNYSDMVILSKKIGSKGNSIPNFKTSPIVSFDKNLFVEEEVFSDCPKVSIRLINDEYVVSVWDWVPGPGPGDFELTFSNEELAIEEVWNYFFGDNHYFRKRLEYHIQK